MGWSDSEAEPAGTCRLCHRPLRGAPGEKDAFCCAGCAHVFRVLRNLDPGAGETYLRAARALGIIPADPGAAAAGSAGIGIVAGEAAGPADALPADPTCEREERFRLEGISCPSCAWIIEQVLSAQPGVSAVQADFFSNSGTVRLDLRQTSLDRLDDALSPLGYRLRRLQDEAHARIGRGLTFDFVVSAVITMNLMSLAAIRYAHDAGWIGSVPGFLPWVELVLCLPVLWLGWVPGLRRVGQALRRRTATMDLLIVVSVGAAFALSCAALATGRPDIYFETAAGLVTISLLGRMVEARLRERAFRDTAAMMRLGIAWVRTPGENGEESYRPMEQVRAGERAMFLQEEIVPFDGEVVSGEVLVSEAVLTGEPRPLRKVAGDRVVAGSAVVQCPLHLRIIRPFHETRLHLIAEALRQALRQSEGRLRSADALAAWLAPLVLILALGVWLARWAAGGLEHALSADGWFPSVAMLAVACPCAFSLAGVTALTAATGALLQRGLLVREPLQLEALHLVQTVVLDKTGTLTEGRMRVEALVWREQEQPELLGHLLAAEAHALHPIAHAVRNHLADGGVLLPGPGPGSVEDLPGQGRRLQLDGRTFVVGAASLFVDPFVPDRAGPHHTLVWLGWERTAEACLLLSDGVRQGARRAVQALKQDGRRVEILSGDRQPVCDWMAREVGADAAVGDATLEQKVWRVEQREAAGERIALVGDGTNDALAMSRASVSVALAGSTDEALTAAGLVMMHCRLPLLPELFALGRRLARVIRENYLWAFAFNAALLPVAAAGLLRPLFAMLLMLGSSSVVLLNSLRLRSSRWPSPEGR